MLRAGAIFVGIEEDVILHYWRRHCFHCNWIINEKGSQELFQEGFKGVFACQWGSQHVELQLLLRLIRASAREGHVASAALKCWQR